MRFVDLVDFFSRLVDFSQEQNQILRLQTSFCQFQTWLLPGLRFHIGILAEKSTQSTFKQTE